MLSTGSVISTSSSTTKLDEIFFLTTFFEDVADESPAADDIEALDEAVTESPAAEEDFADDVEDFADDVKDFE